MQIIEDLAMEEYGVNASGSFPGDPDIATATSLKNILLFLSVAFRYPDKAVYHEVKRLLPVFGEFFNTYAGEVPLLPEEKVLQAEYVRLFVNGRGHVPAVPYASCHLDGGVLMGDSYHVLMRLMERTGFFLDEAVGDMEDHLAILLEYGSVLVDRLIEVPTGGECDSNAIFFSLRKIVFGYLRPMAAPFQAGIKSAATFDFYGITARALVGLLEDAEAVFGQVFGATALEDYNTGAKT